MLAALLGVLLLAQTSPAAATPAPPGPYVGARIDLPHVDKAPVIDGTLNDPAWKTVAAKIQLRWNLRDQQPASESTTVYVMVDARYLYVGFDAKQRAPLQAGQHTNDATLNNDDTVNVDLWPNGSNGFMYAFSANPAGTHVAFSSENSAYAPRWQSAGRAAGSGYTVTMRIPLAVMKGAGTGAWGVQFWRYVAATQDDYVWQHVPQQGIGNEAVSIYSGYLGGVPAQTAIRPKPRVGVYALGEIASNAIGGSTSRLGADISVPVTDRTSLVATLHPDYSNVELDQQTIQPTAYARFLQEVRPFFTQLDNFFNQATCIGCTGQEFYSPFVPTPRAGYALEGVQGPASFAAFDSVGVDGRSDKAAALRLQTKDTKTALFMQQVGVQLPGVTDNNTLFNAVHDSHQGLFEYLTYGTERGTNVTDPSQAQHREAGVGVYSRDGGVYFALRHLGAQYAPPDSLFAQSDIAGYDLNGDYTWHNKEGAFLPRTIVAFNLDRYHGSLHGQNQSDTSFAWGADVRTMWHVRAQTGSSFLRLPSGIFTPVTQNGIDLWYDYHAPTVTHVGWATGKFGPGRLDSWTRSTTLKAGPRAYLSLEADDNIQWLDSGPLYHSWLEKATYTYANGANSSIGLGVRRIIGAFPVLDTSKPNGYVNAWNLSFAYHVRFGQRELYVVYGDANALQTAPRFVVKLIQYAGADKGT